MREVIDHLVGRLRVSLIDGLDTSAPVPKWSAPSSPGPRCSRGRIPRSGAVDQIVQNLRGPDGGRLVTMRDYEGIHASTRPC